MSPTPPRILLSAYRSSNISGELPYLFKKAGCRVEIHCQKASWLRKNSFWDAWYEADGTSPKAYAEGLASHLENREYDWIVLTEDSAVWAANDFVKDERLSALMLPITDLRNRDLLGSKAALSRHCKAHGIPTPAFAVLADEENAAESARAVSYPLLLKEDRSGAGLGITVCTNEIELLAALEAMPQERKKNLLIQKYLRANEVSAEALFKKGELIGFVCSRVLATIAGEFSVSSARRYEQNEAVERLVREAGRALGFDGFCNITLLEEIDSDALYLIEADPRPNAWLKLAQFAGVDFSSAIRRYLSEENAPAESFPVEAVELRLLLRDMKACIRNLDLPGAAAWLYNKDDRWRCIPWYDRKLLFAILLELCNTIPEPFYARYPRMKKIVRRSKAFLFGRKMPATT